MYKNNTSCMLVLKSLIYLQPEVHPTPTSHSLILGNRNSVVKIPWVHDLNVIKQKNFSFIFFFIFLQFLNLGAYPFFAEKTCSCSYQAFPLRELGLIYPSLQELDRTWKSNLSFTKSANSSGLRLPRNSGISTMIEDSYQEHNRSSADFQT